MYFTDDKAQTRQRQTDTAIQFARANRWEEAVSANRAVLKLFPNDADSHNRLGKALMELGRVSQAKKAYKRALELDATNNIARKNLERLNALTKMKGIQAGTVQVDPSLFIEEMGKSAVTVLQETAPDMLAKLNAGDLVELHAKGSTVAVKTPTGDFIGVVEAKLRMRLFKLIEGGNKYAAAVTSVNENECQIIVKETYRDPSQAGKPSFLTSVGTEVTRPYTKQRLVRYESQSEETPRTGDSDLGDNGESDDDWQNERVAQEGHVRLNEAAAAEDDEDDELEE